MPGNVSKLKATAIAAFLGETAVVTVEFLEVLQFRHRTSGQARKAICPCQSAPSATGVQRAARYTGPRSPRISPASPPEPAPAHEPGAPLACSRGLRTSNIPPMCAPRPLRLKRRLSCGSPRVGRQRRRRPRRSRDGAGPFGRRSAAPACRRARCKAPHY